MKTVTEALLFLRPGAKFVVRGEVYDGIEWPEQEQTKPPESEVDAYLAAPDVPRAVTMMQACKVLSRHGLLDTVDNALAAMTGQAGIEARIEWERSREVQRYRPLVLALAQVLGLTPSQVDDLFIEASTL